MKILLVDDHPIFRTGVEFLLKELDTTLEVVHASTCTEGIELAQQYSLNLVFLDLDLPDGSGIDVLKNMKKAHPDLPVVVLSGSSDRDLIQQAIELKAMGYVPKSENTKMLFAAFRSALAGGVFLPANFLDKYCFGLPVMIHQELTATYNEISCNEISCLPEPSSHESLGITHRQLDVLKLLVQGMPNKKIATNLNISVQVTKKHVSDLLAQFKVMNRTQLVIQIAQRGIILGTPEISHPLDEIGFDGVTH